MVLYIVLGALFVVAIIGLLLLRRHLEAQDLVEKTAHATVEEMLKRVDV